MSSVLSSVDPQACKPWDFASFDGDPKAAKAGKTAVPAGVKLPTIEEITAIQEQARQEGYQAGKAEGYAHGQQKATQEAQRLHALTAAFAAEVNQADALIAQQVLDLSLDLARAILKTALAVQPDLVLPIVREAVRYLPSLQQPALLYLHPDDAALIAEKMGVELDKTGWQIAHDPQLERGGCRVETASNQIDATLPTRWQRLTAALGKESDWLES
ncbi:MAG: flagellar assembly protein FliH [Pseudomonadota bacterium]